MLHDPVPVQSVPLQPAKRKPIAGVAVKVTVALAASVTSQLNAAVPQLMVFGADVTDPCPSTVTDSPMLAAPPPLSMLKVATAVAAADIVIVQVSVPPQPGLAHPLNCEPAPGTANNRTLVFSA
jgi:hypothetical protein